MESIGRAYQIEPAAMGEQEGNGEPARKGGRQDTTESRFFARPPTQSPSIQPLDHTLNEEKFAVAAALTMSSNNVLLEIQHDVAELLASFTELYNDAILEKPRACFLKHSAMIAVSLEELRII